MSAQGDMHEDTLKQIGIIPSLSTIFVLILSEGHNSWISKCGLATGKTKVFGCGVRKRSKHPGEE